VDALVILLATAALMGLIYLNQYFYYRQHLGSLGHDRDYRSSGSRGEVIVEAQPDPLPTTELVLYSDSRGRRENEMVKSHKAPSL